MLCLPASLFYGREIFVNGARTSSLQPAARVLTADWDVFISEKVNSVIVEPFALIHLLTDSDFDLTNQRLFSSQVVC